MGVMLNSFDLIWFELQGLAVATFFLWLNHFAGHGINGDAMEARDLFDISDKKFSLRTNLTNAIIDLKRLRRARATVEKILEIGQPDLSYKFASPKG